MPVVGRKLSNALVIPLGTAIWRNGRITPLAELCDNLAGWTNIFANHVSPKRDLLLGTATKTSDQTIHSVLLVPFEFVTETEKGSGQYQKLGSLPIFVPNDGTGRGLTKSANYDIFSIKLTENLNATVVNTIEVNYQSPSGNFTGTLTETSVNSGVFQNAGGAFIMALNPPVTTSDTTQETLRVLVTASGLGLNNSPMALLETWAASKEFVKPQMDVELILTAALASGQPDTVNLRLQGEGSYDLTLTETGNDTRVFKTADNLLTLSLSNYNGLNSGAADILEMTYSTASLPDPVTYQLVERSADSKIFANFTVGQGNRPVADPVESHDGVFYLKLSGFAGQTVPVKLKSGANEITVQATAPQGVTDYVMTPPLMLARAGSSPSYSGINVLQLAEGVSDVQTFLMGMTSPAMASKTRLPAFLGMALSGVAHLDLSASGVPSEHFDRLDHIIGRKATSWFFWSTPPKLGYSPSTVDEAVSISSLQDALPNHSIFYLVAHGRAQPTIDDQNVDFEGFVVWNGWTVFASCDHLVTATEIDSHIGDNEYNLVFPNACGGANDSSGIATAYANAFRAKNYVGWQFPVVLSDAAGSAEQFFNALDGGNTVAQAVDNITATQYIGPMMGGLGNKIPLTLFRDDPSIIIDITP
jgi:hypothetical protein